ncbi:MAG TPA: alkaline phosphatase family protein [Solirubrobacteraceae bacterium]|nr:alkaline phosphatase family protein [Solirubrobacteraceae bacterium]
MASTFVANGRRYRVPTRRLLAICADGWDPAYVDDALARALMPRLAKAIAEEGTYVFARAQVPTFTNPNNVTIVTGVSAAHHGIAGNHYRDESGNEVQVTDPSFLRATTIYDAAQQAGVSVLCVTAKDKLRALLATGGVPAFSAELAHEQTLPDGTRITDVVGAPNPDIYDWRLSVYTVDLAVALAKRIDAQLVYASLTDYVQHSAAPGEAIADEFYRAIDGAIGRALDAGFVIGLAADHGMRAKTSADGSPNVRFLDDALAEHGVRSAHTLCPITDPYVAHHAALGSLAWVHLDDLGELEAARGVLAGLTGVEAVLDRFAAADAFDLPADRIGDLIVLADGDTALGKSRESHDLSALHGALRSHGGVHERTVPMIFSHRLADGALDGRDLRSADLHDLLLNATAEAT